MKKILVLLLVTIVIVAAVGFYAVELSPTNKIKQYAPQPNIPYYLINDTSGKLIKNTKQSHFGSSVNLEEPSYLPSYYIVRQIRDDTLRNTVNMYLSTLEMTDETSYFDFVFKEGGIVVYVRELPNDFNQIRLVNMRIDSNYPHHTINDRDFFFSNSKVENYQGEKWDIPTFVEMYDKQVMIEAYGFISSDELIEIVRSIKYDQPAIHSP